MCSLIHSVVSIKRTGSLNYFEGFYHPDCFFHVLNEIFSSRNQELLKYFSIFFFQLWSNIANMSYIHICNFYWLFFWLFLIIFFRFFPIFFQFFPIFFQIFLNFSEIFRIFQIFFSIFTFFFQLWKLVLLSNLFSK